MKLKTFFLAVGCFFAALRVVAFTPTPYTEGVSFSYSLTGDSGTTGGGSTVTVYGEGSTSVGCSTNTVESTVVIALLRPGKQYIFTHAGTLVGSNNATGGSYKIGFTAPAGYAIFINGLQQDLWSKTLPSVPANQLQISDSYSIELRPLANSAPATAGSFSGIEVGKSITWEVGLGALSTGRSAGRIVFKEADLANSPASRGRLYYTLPANNGQIKIFQDGPSNQTYRQISTPQTIANLVDDVSGGYWIKFYTPSPTALNTWNGTFYTLDGETPWRTIRIQTPAANQITATENEGGVVRISTLVLTSGSISSGTYVWTLQEGDASTILRTSTHASTIPASGQRDDLVTVRTGGTTGTIVAQTKYHYVSQNWGEEVTQVIADPNGAALTTSYTYFTANSAYGNYRKIQSVVDPTGNWTSFLYYDTWGKRGQLSVETHPFQDTPGTSQSAAIGVGNSVSHDYLDDFSGRFTIESNRQHQITAITAGQRLTTRNLNAGLNMNGQSFTTYVASDYSGNGALQQTTTEVSNPNVSSSDHANEIYSVKRPDQSQDSYAYYLGDYNGTTFTPGAGNFFRTNVWHGSTNSSGATSFATYASATVTTINLLPNQSTMDVIIQNPAGLVLRKETQVYGGGSTFTLIAWENFTYDVAGRLTQRVASNGTTVDTPYTGGRLAYATDASGVRTDFTYDAIGRVYTSTKKGVAAYGAYPAQADITTTYTYDGANHVTNAQTTGGALTLTATSAYDLAGRLYQQVQYSGSGNSLTTSYAYTSGGRIVTTTLPGGSATRIIETFLDGQIKQTTGTAVVPEYSTYTVNADGTVARQVNVSSASSSAWVKVTTDWLGRQISETKPGWNGSNVTSTWHYNNLGQLDICSQPGIASKLFVYDTLGGLLSEGLDINADGSLTPASSDRITSHAWTFFLNGANWWRRDTTSTYATLGSGTATQTNKVETQLSGLAANRVSLANSTDIFGNLTVAYTDVDRINKIVTTTTDTPDSTTNAVQISNNGLLMSEQDTVGVMMKYGYDALGRATQSINPRTGTSTTAYKPGTSFIDWVKDPATVAQSTYIYDSAGRASTVTDAFNKVARYEYNDRNQKIHEWGDTTYPTESVYDAYGRQTQLKTYAGSAASFTGATWPVSPGTPAYTLWVYHTPTGLLKEKYDAANLDATGQPITNAAKIAFTYSQAGQVATKSNARAIVATYTYSTTTAELMNVSYSDGTPTLGFTYNRLGQQSTVADFTGTRTFNYNLAGTLEFQSEDLPAFFGTRRLTFDYDQSGTGTKGRLASMGLGTPASHYSQQYQDFGYQPDGRLVYSGVYAAGYAGLGFNYGYEPNSHLVNQVNQFSGQYVSWRNFDAQHDWVRNCGTSVSSVSKGDFGYTPDIMGRTLTVTKKGELFNRYGDGTQGLTSTYGYDDRSQLKTNGTTVGATGTPLTGRADSYVFDNLGNRTSTTHNAATATYAPNSVNQYSSRSVAGVFDVAGAASASATVFTDGVAPARHGGYFFQNFQLNNSSAKSTTSVLGVTPQVKSLNGIYGFNWQNLPVSTPTVTGPSGQSVVVLEFGGSPWHVGMDVAQHGYTFQNGRTYTFSFWARTPSGTRSLTAMMTDDGNGGITSTTQAIDTNWKWITVTKTYASVGGGPRLFYTWDGGGVPFQVYGAQVADITDPAYAGLTSSFTAATPESFAYDADGNLTGDGRWSYQYNAENRLTWMNTSSSAIAAGMPNTALGFYYDYLGRRVCKLNYVWSGGTWAFVSQQNYIYNGWNLIAELDTSMNITKNFFWGLDLSGTGQGAGGVGGLLMVQDGGQSYLPMYDATGNVHGMIKASDGSIAAAYEYDAFGNTLRESGTYAASNSFRYSTKYTDSETGLVYYGLRYYSPSLGRFINKDPIEEMGGLNLYGFCGNNGVNSYDLLGMSAENGLDAFGREDTSSWSEKRKERNEDVKRRMGGGNSGTYGNDLMGFSDAGESLEDPYTMTLMMNHLNDFATGADWSATHRIAKGPNGETWIVTDDLSSVADGANVVFRGTAAQAAANAATASANLDAYTSAIVASAERTFGNGGLRRDPGGKPVSALVFFEGNTQQAVDKTNELLNQLRNSINGPLDVPTMAASRLKWLDENGYAEFIVYRGARDETWPLDEHGNRDSSRIKFGVSSLPQIVFDPYNPDALSGLAHEVDHAYLILRGLQYSGHLGEYDPVRVENEIRALYLHLPSLKTHTGADIPNEDLYLKGGRK